MPRILNSTQLLETLLQAINESGWRALVLNNSKPFRIRVYSVDRKGFDVRVYIWNCTHGGGAARAADEYRVQLTGVVPSQGSGEVTLLLGWHSEYEVFVGFDMLRHAGQNSQSPSIQIREPTLQSAHVNSFGIHHRANGEIAVAFRPEFLVEYALNSESLHKMGKATVELSMLTKLDDLQDTQIDQITNNERKLVVSSIARKYRALDFRKRVLGAYKNQCAVCGVQLQLIDAAHIIPVAASTSTDETKNGIALCKIHHQAFDRNLLSFDENYKIELSNHEVDRLTAANLVAGLDHFKANLKKAILLPSDRRDYPPQSYITESRTVRNWRG